MSVAVGHPEPWTIESLYALPEDGMRHELLDGTLLVSPPPGVPHQLAARRLVAALAAAAPADVEVLEAVGVAVPAGLLVPDVVVARASAVHGAGRELSSRDVLSVMEIVSPSSRTNDRRWKPAAYAEGGIPSFWRVELDAGGGPEVVVHVLTGEGYQEIGRLSPGERSSVETPFPLTLDPATLVGPPHR